MLFKIQELKKFLSYAAKYKVEHINIKSANLMLTINTKKHQSRLSINRIKSFGQKSIVTSTVKSIPRKDVSNIKKDKNQYFTIVSPMIGTFYRSPAPNEKPFIDIDDKVQTGQTVCIIEAMKLMNEIESEVNGKIVEMLVKDGDIVDCGQALIKIEQDRKI